MSITRYFLPLLIALGLTLAACSDDDNGSTPSPEPDVENLKTQNDVDFFTEAFIESDSLGRFQERVNGRPLPSISADTTLLFLGVENVKQARSKFLSWLPADAQKVEKDDQVIFYPTDTLGRSQGTITFTPYSSDGMDLARVVISDDCPIRRDWISAVRFISKTAWPDNAVSIYEVGDVVKNVTLYYSFSDNVSNTFTVSRALCVKPYESGSSGILLARMDEATQRVRDFIHGYDSKQTFKLIYEKNKNDNNNIHNIAAKLSILKALRSLYYPEGVSADEVEDARKFMEAVVEEGLDINLEKGTVRDGSSWKQVTHSNRPSLIWTTGYKWHPISKNEVQGYNFTSGEAEWFSAHNKWYGMLIAVVYFDEQGKITGFFD